MFLFGANLAEQQAVRFALRNVFGIGPFKADRICHQLQIHPRCRVQDLTDSQISSVAKLIEQDPDKCGHELQRKIAQRVMHYHNIKSYRGDRLARGYVVLLGDGGGGGGGGGGGCGLACEWVGVRSTHPPQRYPVNGQRSSSNASTAK